MNVKEKRLAREKQRKKERKEDCKEQPFFAFRKNSKIPCSFSTAPKSSSAARLSSAVA
jgi:hypothetical protein